VTHGKSIQAIKDALTRGIGGILEQQNAEGKWQPVSYYSSSLSKEERDYSATELECKALHDYILHYAVYLKYIPHFERSIQ
jgi:hypothetical protein